MWGRNGIKDNVIVGKQPAKEQVKVTGPRWPTMAAQD